MIFGFIKKLVKYYVDKFIDWLRMQRFSLELDNDIKKYHEELDKKVKTQTIIEKVTFGRRWLVYFYRRRRRWRYLIYLYQNKMYKNKRTS